MIIGIGSDLIDIRRIENSLQRFGERFVNRCFTDIEIAKSEGRKTVRPPMPSVSPQRRRVPRH